MASDGPQASRTSVMTSEGSLEELKREQSTGAAQNGRSSSLSIKPAVHLPTSEKSSEINGCCHTLHHLWKDMVQKYRVMRLLLEPRDQGVLLHLNVNCQIFLVGISLVLCTVDVTFPTEKRGYYEPREREDLFRSFAVLCFFTALFSLLVSLTLMGFLRVTRQKVRVEWWDDLCYVLTFTSFVFASVSVNFYVGGKTSRWVSDLFNAMTAVVFGLTLLIMAALAYRAYRRGMAHLHQRNARQLDHVAPAAENDDGDDLKLDIDVM